MDAVRRIFPLVAIVVQHYPLIFGEALENFIANPAFEQVCQQYLVRLNREQKLPFFATSFGKWWESKRAKQEETDLDIVMGG